MAGTKKKERKDKKEKPLERWTIKEMRDECLKMEGIQGFHGMNKEELLAFLREAKGITAPPTKNTNVREVKAKVLELRKKRAEAAAAGATKEQLNILRRKVSRMKKKTRIAG